MLSSLTSFLPSRLQGATLKDVPRAAVIPDEEQSDDEDGPEPPALASQPDSKPVKSRDRDGKGPSETFVFVRPPPSKSNHPLNLQVQLVPPNSRPPTGVTDPVPSTPLTAASTTFSISDGTSLRRTPSNQSQSSASTYNNSSTTSFASIASSSTSSGTRRAIIPLYNLQAHNVMTNVIVDAGTDAKIAKFQKRGIELIDLAFLEPVEVWGEKDGRSKDTIEVEKRARRESMRLSVDEAGVLVTTLTVGGNVKGNAICSKKSTGSLMPGGAGPGARSAASSVTSLNSQPLNGGGFGEHSSQQDNRHLRPSDSRASVRSDSKSPLSSSPVTPTSFSDQSSVPTPTQKKNIFGKLFTKKGSSTPSSTSTVTPTGTTHLSKPTDGLPSFASFSILQSPKTPQMTKQGPEDEDESMLHTPTAAPKEKSHGRNLSLTGIAAPIKTTLMNNRNRLSGLVNGMSPLSNANSLGVKDESASQARSSADKGRDSSPNPSVARSARSRLSWAGAASTTTRSTDSLPGDHCSKETNIAITPTQPPLMITPSYLEGTSNARQPQPQQLQFRPPVLGCQPSFVSSVASPLVATLSPRLGSEKDAESLLQGQRALIYVWLVRKWLKKRASTIAGSGEATAAAMVGSLFGKKKEASAPGGQDTSGPPSLPYGGVEVRFEWKRAKGKEAKRGRRRRTHRTASGVSSIGGAIADSDAEVELASTSGRVKIEDKRNHRMSTGSFATTVSEENGFGLHSSPGSKQTRRDRDDAEESDPEDSETPWVCTLKIRRSAAAAASTISVNGGRISPVPPRPIISPPPGVVPLEPQVLRIKVGTLSPTPHHPKVVAMLKVPYPLPDVEVEKMGVIKRDVRSMGMRPSPATGSGNRDAATADREPYAGLTLTAEEIKDVVCSTGLWLVVREGFGGVGKVTRKGDGWRIRG